MSTASDVALKITANDHVKYDHHYKIMLQEVLGCINAQMLWIFFLILSPSCASITCRCSGNDAWKGSPCCSYFKNYSCCVVLVADTLIMPKYQFN